ncbi:MAG: Hsp20/alpha crystallin family protein [Candidatus Kariarchaeaceae archaeon]|jgi:HSP20 family molecular chaperone IbpA
MTKEPKDRGFAFFSSDGKKFSRVMPPQPPFPPEPPFPPGVFSKGFVFNTGGSATNQIHQTVEDESLIVYFALPGIEKESLKLRSKQDKISIMAAYKEEYAELFGEPEINTTFDLIETVLPDHAKAGYRDGILKIQFPLSEPAAEVAIEDIE